MISNTDSQHQAAPNVDLSRFRNERFDRGAGIVRESLWSMVSLLVFQLLPVCASRTKRILLRLFGARVEAGVVIKPRVRITFPWKLAIGNNTWLGEDCWILNLAPVTIGSNVCISQRAFVCTGNHDYRDPTFSLMNRPITIRDGAWIGAASFVAPGVTVGRNAVLTACSQASRTLEADTVYSGVPAQPVRCRWRALAPSLTELFDVINPT